MNLREVLSTLRVTLWLPVVGMLLGGVAAFAVTHLQTPEYTASTQLFVSTTGSTSTTDLSQGSQFAQQRVASYAHIITGPDFAQRLIQRLDLPMSPQELSAELTATPVTNTVLLDVTVTDPSPQRAQQIAAAVGVELAGFARDLEADDSTAAVPVKVTVTGSPQLPTAPSSPQRTLDVGLGMLGGLVIGAGLVIVRARLDTSVKDSDATAVLARAPVIGVVPRDHGLAKRHVVDPRIPGRAVEQFRQLRTNLQQLEGDPARTILISSARPAEGRTTVAINLGLALTEGGHRVALVEADLRHPTVARYLGMRNDIGLTNLLAGGAELDEVVQPYRTGALSVITAGPPAPDGGELLASGQMPALQDKLLGRNDFVLIDAPPLLAVADSSALAVHTEGVLLTVRWGSTSKNDVRQAAAVLNRVGVRTLGVVLTDVPPRAEKAMWYSDGAAVRHSTS